jgi:hypothetical protein
MNYDSNFNRMVKDLEDDERLSLLAKFSKYSTSNNALDEIESIESKQKVDIRDRSEYINMIYDKYGFFNKLFVFLKQTFSGKTKEEVVLELETTNLKRDIKTTNGNLIDFEKNQFTQYFIKEFTPFIKLKNDIEPLIDSFFIEPFYYYGFLSSILENSFNEKVKDALNEITPENVEIKIEYLDKSIFLKEKERRIKKYFSQIEIGYHENIVSQFTKFELIIKIIKFDFDSLLRSFYIVDINEPLTQNNYCEFSQIIDLIERFYRMIYSVNFGIEDIPFIYEMVNYSNNFPSTNPKINVFTENDIIRIIQIFDEIRDIKSKIPFDRIFQYIKRDLLYSPKIVKLGFNFGEIYKEYKKTIIDMLWEQHYDKVRIDNLNKLIHELLNIYDFNTLSSFNLELREKINKYSSVDLKNVHLLNFITEFVKTIYKSKIEIIVNRCIIDGIFKKELVKTNVSIAYYSLNRCADKIREFDNRFREDKDLGKKISLSLKRMSTDINFRASLLNLVNDINDESDKILLDLYDSLNTVYDFINNLATIDNPSNVPITNLEAIKIPGYPISYIAIDSAISILNLFFRIYKLIQDIYQ